MFMRPSFFWFLTLSIISCQSSGQSDVKQQLSDLQFWIDSVQLASYDNQALDSLSWSLLNEDFISQFENISNQNLSKKEARMMEETKAHWAQFNFQYHKNMQSQIDSFLRAAKQDSINADTSLFY